MNIIIIILITLISYLLVWYVANIIVYYFSIALKKPVIFESFHAISLVFLWLYNAILGGVLIWVGISLFLNKQYLWLIIYLFIGSSIVGWFFNILQLPFIFIQTYFADKLERFDFNENVIEAEILDDKNRVIGKTEGESNITRRLAIYFVLFYVINFISMLVFPDENKNYNWGDYLVTPFLQIIGGTIIIGIPYAIYHAIRYRRLIQSDKRYFLIAVWKIWLVIFVILTIFSLTVRLLYKSY